MSLRLHLFGTPRLEGPNGPVGGRCAMPRQLAFLALVGAPVGGMTRDRIASYLWPENPEPRALVADVLHILRRSLGEEALRTVGESVCLDPSHIGCDVGDFRAAASAGDWERMLRLYEGPFLDGFHGTGGGDFERWAEDERVRCREIALQASVRLADRCEGSGNLPDAAEWLRRGRAVDPYDEGIARRLMMLLVRAGDRAGAVRIYRDLHRRLRTELGLDPSPRTRDLARRVGEGGARPFPLGSASA